MKIFYIFLLTNFLCGCNTNYNLIPVNGEDDDNIINEVEKAFYYVATNGNDNNPGTYDKPWATWQRAFTKAIAGDTVYIRGGIYYASTEDEYGVYKYKKSGTYSKPICIFNYPGEVPVLDCSSITRSSDNIGIYLNQCNYIHLKGLTVRGVRQPTSNAESNGISIESSNGIRFENCTSHSNGGPGFFAFDTDTIYFINCDAHDNFDRITDDYSGGQADGFVVCYTSKKSYTYYNGSRSWYNSDDGYDCWENEGVVVFNNCWAFNNGRGDGDGSGFKLGRTVNQPSDFPQRILRNCLAFKNRFSGFNQNGGDVNMTLYNNIAYDNDLAGFELTQFNNEIIIRNNISYKNGSANDFAKSVSHDHNSWDSSPSLTVTDADFASTDSSGISGERQYDGSLPEIIFLNLNNGSDLINAGINVGLPFKGSAPDLGAFEKD